MNINAPTLGIDLGGTKILAAVVDADGVIMGRAKNRTKPEQGVEAVVRRIVETALEALRDANVPVDHVDCIGIGAPGPLDPVSGVVLEAPNMGWKDVPLAAYLSEKLGPPTYLANDVNAGTWGEYVLGAGRGAQSVLGVFVGTGIGGGLVIEGKLFEGASRVAGEIGHICIDPKGPICGCGQKGCLEAFASRTAITRDIWQAIREGEKSRTLEKEERGSMIRSKQILRGIVSEDRLILNVLDKSTKIMGIGLASVANLLNPDRIILGGGVVAALGEYYIDRVRLNFNERAFNSVLVGTELVEANLGDDAGVLGAALLARQANAHQERAQLALSNG